MDRTILHCDMDGFYASVELLDHPELKDSPVAVCGNPENRHGIILAKNARAKKYGITTAETVWQAKKKCPDLRLLPPHHYKYKEFSLKINDIYQRFTDMVEPFSIDESWLDVSASLKLFGTGKEIADMLRETVKTELGLTLSVGVSFNKIFAKMGSDYNKPDGTTVISCDNYKDILWPMNVRKMFFVGEATADKLNKTGIKTIGDLARSDRTLLTALLGKQGGMLYEYANGLDSSPVCRYSEREKIKSVGNGTTFRRNLQGMDDIKVAVTALSDTVASRLRKYQMKAFGVKVDIKDPEFKIISRQKQLSAPTNLAEEICRAAIEIISSSWRLRDPIRMLTITAINLCDENESEQLSLFDLADNSREESEKVERTIDNIRAKFGDKAITFGRVINNDIGIDMDDNRTE
ncbi:DNA polymerase IV [Anaerovorax odorimutans]|uniref:DNA polymerase IV n=1 Tax=Anaerovorax odorimutans TaxID=109327 RepID=A0ABT1RMF6_9FIRM|nr:DNA polymerase IV [Anaerovorax odorimutans]MCQ4636357.1 DNA polymerase IV [Anaerovorax odorimutans]